MNQLDSIYSFGVIGEDHVAHNRFFGSLLQLVDEHMKLPVLGEVRTAMQVPLTQIPSTTKKLPNAAVEISFYEQCLLERLGLSVPPDYYKRRTLAMCSLYMLNSSACVVAKKGIGKYSIRATSLEVVKSFPRNKIENYSKRHEDYFAVDARPDLEIEVLKSLQFRRTSSHRIHLSCVLTQLKGCTIIPLFLAEAFVRKLLEVLSHNIVTIQYKEEKGNILTVTTSLRMDFLQKHCGGSARAIQSRCRNICNEMEITLPVIPKGVRTAKFLTMNILGICSVCKVRDNDATAPGKTRISP